MERGESPAVRRMPGRVSVYVPERAGLEFSRVVGGRLFPPVSSPQLTSIVRVRIENNETVFMTVLRDVKSGAFFS
jgi:hypothetical protein